MSAQKYGEPGETTPRYAGVPSPCIHICQMNPATQWCDGCLRTIDEIRDWSSLNDEARRAVWAQLATRRAWLTQNMDA